MILYNWRGPAQNFGDELNTLLWPRLLPDFFDHDGAARFLGIGSILDGRHDPTALKLVAGSGYGGYEAPIVLDETWVVHWVRGRRTARMLGLPLCLGIGDPASLIPLAGLAPPRENQDIGFMPHFESAIRGAWREAAALAGITLIDPRDDPRSVIAAISRCRVILSEALHGVIVADALRVPWIAVEPLAPIHRPKWLDWAETVDLTIAFHRLPPSTLLERAHLSGMARFHAGRCLLNRQAARLRAIARNQYIDRAAQALRKVARAAPQLSGAGALDRGQSRMVDAIAALRRDPMRRPHQTEQVQIDPPPLHRRAVSAYHEMPGRLIA
ncbi:MAG: hypothetical protein EXR07_00030 [Acetobacteraceae bacterium]|nr:hypothetical protein [Acetobacteraceae bacterium]